MCAKLTYKSDVRHFRTHPSGSTQLASLFVFFVFSIYIVCSLEDEDSLENLCFSSFVPLKSVRFNLLYVFEDVTKSR